MTGPLAATHALAEVGHTAKHRVDLSHDVHAVDDQRLALGHAQRHVKHRAVLRDVDALAFEHRLRALAKGRLLGELEQQRERSRRHAVLGVVEVQPCALGDQSLAAAWVVGEQLAQVDVADRLVVTGERLPGGALGQCGRIGHGPESIRARHPSPRACTTLRGVEAEELRRRIAAFPVWNYRFEFEGGIVTPVNDRGLVNRQRQRYAYLFERLLALTGGSLSGRRVLDLGCNAGFWSLAAHRVGADFVLGIDADEQAIEQARLVFEANDVDQTRYLFRTEELFAHALDDRFDVVLCLGIMDQIDRPVELFELMAASGARTIVIDTNVSRSRASLFETTRLYAPGTPSGDGLVLLPSRQAVADLAARHGFTTVALAQNTTDRAGMSDYRRERRCAFICSRDTKLADLPAEQRPRMVPWWVRDPAALIKL